MIHLIDYSKLWCAFWLHLLNFFMLGFMRLQHLIKVRKRLWSAVLQLLKNKMCWPLSHPIRFIADIQCTGSRAFWLNHFSLWLVCLSTEGWGLCVILSYFRVFDVLARHKQKWWMTTSLCSAIAENVSINRVLVTLVLTCLPSHLLSWIIGTN